MPADKAVAQRPHGVTQDVPRDCLNNVLHEFRAVTFDPLPFFCRAHAFVGDGFAAKFVLADLRFHIGQSPAGRKLDKQYPWRTAKNEPFDSGRRYIWRYEIRPKVQANRAQRAQFRQIGGFSRFYRSQSLQALQQNHEKTERCLNAP